MMEQLVDLVRRDGTVLRTYPVAIENPEDDLKSKALQVAEHAKMLPDHDGDTATVRVHVDRGGPLLPYGDDRHVLSGTRQGLEKVLRERAYFIWQHDGHEHGRAEEHWHRAFEQHLRERAYFLWLQHGCPEGLASKHWQDSIDFETYC